MPPAIVLHLHLLEAHMKHTGCQWSPSQGVPGMMLSAALCLVLQLAFCCFSVECNISTACKGVV